MQVKKNVDVFNKDVLKGQGYQYTTNANLSSRISNERMTKATEYATQWLDKKVLDIGCGDGTYTYELLKMGSKSVLGIDPANMAIDKARENFANTPGLEFAVGNIYALDELKQKFDIVVIRGVLHHLPDAAKAIEMVAKVAHEIIILEPIGIFVGLIATIFIAAAHFSDALGMGSKQDPLGYFVQAKRCY